MRDDIKTEELLEQLSEIQEREIQHAINAGEETLSFDDIENSKQKFLKNFEVHKIAHKLIEKEVNIYREDLYLFCKKVAVRESESHMITERHVVKAREFLWRRKNKYDFADGFLTIGGLLTGIGITQIIEIFNKANQATPNPYLIILGIIGGILLGMGIISKAKS